MCAVVCTTQVQKRITTGVQAVTACTCTGRKRQAKNAVARMVCVCVAAKTPVKVQQARIQHVTHVCSPPFSFSLSPHSPTVVGRDGVR